MREPRVRPRRRADRPAVERQRVRHHRDALGRVVGLAVDLYGEARVAEEWRSDGSMRGRVRWRVKQALKLMNGGYRTLVSGDS